MKKRTTDWDLIAHLDAINDPVVFPKRGKAIRPATRKECKQETIGGPTRLLNSKEVELLDSCIRNTTQLVDEGFLDGEENVQVDENRERTKSNS